MTIASPVAGNGVLVESCDTNPIDRSWTVVKGGASSGSGAAGQIKVQSNYCLDVKVCLILKYRILDIELA